MSWLSKLFGGGSAASAPSRPSEEHAGFRITPAPIAEGGQHRICAIIEKEVDGETRTHRMIRADVMNDADAAASASLAKAKAFIDQEGERLFGHPSA